MKKLFFLSLLLVSSLACATIEKALSSEATPTPFIVPTEIPQQTAVPIATDITRKEETNIHCSSSVDEAVDAYNKAVTYETAGDTASAEKAYREALALDPNYCDAMDNLALLLRQNGNTEEAIALYENSIKIAPDNEVAHLGLANTYMGLEEYDKALVEYNALLDINPSNPEGYYGAGRVYFSKENYNEAIKQFLQAEQLYKAEGSAYIVDAQIYLGFSYALIEEYETGRDYLELVYPQMPDNGYVNYFLGYCYYYGTSIRDEKLAKEYLLRARDLGIDLGSELENFVNTP
jgi:tetratricopeptide (TPR) repeat protein